MDSTNSNNPPQYAPVHVPLQTPLIMQSQTTAWGPKSQNHVCHHCHAQILTKVKSKASQKTHLMAMLCCLCFCWLCAPCVYCMKSCTVQEHYCPNCENYLGMHNKN